MNESAASATSTLRGYISAARRQWYLVLGVMVLTIGAAVFWVQRQESEYQANMKVVVGQGRALFGPSVSFAVEPFTQTMTDLLKSDVIAQQVINQENLTISSERLLDRLEVTTRPDASVLTVTYRDTDRARASRVLQAVGDTFTELVDERLGGNGPAPAAPDPTNGQDRTSEPVTATVFDPARTEPERVSPKERRTYAIAAVLGLIAGLLLALLRDAMSNRIRGYSDAQQAFESPVAGVLPPGTVGTSPTQVQHLPPRLSQSMGDAFEILGATLRFSGREGPGSAVILVTSSSPEEGKTTVVANVAAFLARSGLRVIAVEGDLRRPALHRFLDIEPNRRGLSDVARGEASIADVLVPISLGASQQTNGAPEPAEAATRESGRVRWGRDTIRDERGFLMLPAGTRLQESYEILTMGQSAELMAELRDLTDFVIVDSAPLLLAPDAFAFAQLADRVLVVAREDTTTRHHAESTRDVLRTLGVREFSVVLTESGEAERRSYGYEPERAG